MKKIPTIFKRNPENMKYILRDPHPDCLWVFEGEGIATRMYDGICVAIINGQYVKRREIKKVEGLLSISSGSCEIPIPAKELDGYLLQKESRKINITLKRTID